LWFVFEVNNTECDGRFNEKQGRKEDRDEIDQDKKDKEIILSVCV